MAGYYDPKKDYSVAIEQAKAKGQDTTKLEQERANKIADKYGGKEPTMYGSNQTYSQLSGSNASSSNQQIVRDAVNTANSGKNAGVVAQMETAAQKGDWDLVGSLANQLATPDGYYGGENLAYANEVFNNLSKKYGYNANDYYGKKYDSVYGQGAWDGGTGTGKPVYNGTQTSVVPGNEAYGSFDQFLDQMGYDTYADQTQNAIRAAVQQAILGYQGQIEDTNEDSEELARQAYINMMLGGKNLDQQMAAGGYAGGMADSQRIALQANYENNLNQLERQRAATVDELQRAITNAQLTGDMQTAQELSNYLQQVQSQWANYVQYQQSLANDNYWRQQSLAAENQSAARDMALAIIQSGSMPDDETLSAAGISRTQAQALTNYAQRQNASAVARNTSTPKYTENQALVALNALAGGSNDATARAIVESYYGMPAETVLLSAGFTQQPDKEEAIASAAAEYRKQYPNVTLDSRTLDGWLSANGYTGNDAQLFKAYLEEYGATYQRR